MHLENSPTVIVPTACLHNFAINDGDFIEEESLKLQWNLSLSTAPVEPDQKTAQDNELLITFFNFDNCILTTFFHTGKPGSVNIDNSMITKQLIAQIINRSINYFCMRSFFVIFISNLISKISIFLPCSFLMIFYCSFITFIFILFVITPPLPF